MHAPKDDLVCLLQQRLNDSNLGRHLGASHNGHKWPLGLLDSAIKVVQLLLQQKTSHAGAEELCDAFSGGMRSVGCAKSVVDKDVGVSCKLRSTTERQSESLIDVSCVAALKAGVKQTLLLRDNITVI